MLQREVSTATRAHACPECGSQLVQDGDVLLCADHGAFFAYGPHLLVRAPAPESRQPHAPLPWEVVPAGRTH